MQVNDLDHVRVLKAAQVTLTVAAREQEAAQGHITRFWKKVNDTWGQQRFFWWMEMQKRGQVHYHALWLNPPHLGRNRLKAWVSRTWGDDRTQVRFRSSREYEREKAEYVLAYAKKMGAKAYQQDYEEVMPSLRTFGNQRLQYDGRELDNHRDRELVLYVPAQRVDHQVVEEHLIAVASIQHVLTRWANPQLHGCDCPPRPQRPRGRPRAPGRRGAARG
jgi:hypothetical protein